MLQLSLATVRAHAARFVATCLAIVISVAFIVATLVLNATSRDTVYESVAAQYAGVDAVTGVLMSAQQVRPGETDHAFSARIQAQQRLDVAESLARVRALPEVAAAALDRTVDVAVRLPGRTGQLEASVESVAGEAPLRWQRMLSGRLPASDGEVAVANQVDAAIGSTVTLSAPMSGSIGVNVMTGDLGASSRLVEQTATVVGIVDQRGDPRAAGEMRLFATEQQTAAWGDGAPERIRVIARPGVDNDRLFARLQALSRPGDMQYGSGTQTGAQAAADAVASYTGNAAAITNVLLAFAAVAVLVSALVIANTFAVLLAQRTRELALLRCVGATRGQVRRGVLLESAVVGAGSSLLGVFAGVGAAAALVQLAPRFDSPVPVAGLSVPASAVVIGVGVGVLMTVLAALAPAYRATAVAPLAALRPVDDAPLRSRAGVARLVAGLVLLVPGLVVLVAGAVVGVLLIGLVGGAASFLGFMMLARRVVPWLVGALGRATGRLGGVPGEMAAANAVRNPARTAATALALMIGVTLTTTMVVGAASTRASASGVLDSSFDTDVEVQGTGRTPLPDSLSDTIGSIDGVAEVMAVPSASVTGLSSVELGGEVMVDGVDGGRAEAVVRSRADLPKRGEIVIPHLLGEPDGRRVTVSANGRSIDLTVREDSGNRFPAPRMNLEDLRVIAPKAEVNGLWVRLDADAANSPVTAISQITDASGVAAPGSVVSGPARERAAFDRVVDIMLLVVTLLLAVAVLIAVIGVGNTIALSVIERRQETGLLRALGLTRRQLRTMLLWEAALVAGVASVAGVALGILYGATGTASVFSRATSMGPIGEFGSVVIDIPWLQTAVIVLIATIAGAMASVLPARRAARRSPVEAIATA